MTTPVPGRTKRRHRSDAKTNETAAPERLRENLTLTAIRLVCQAFLGLLIVAGAWGTGVGFINWDLIGIAANLALSLSASTTLLLLWGLHFSQRTRGRHTQRR